MSEFNQAWKKAGEVRVEVEETLERRGNREWEAWREAGHSGVPTPSDFHNELEGNWAGAVFVERLFEVVATSGQAK